MNRIVVIDGLYPGFRAQARGYAFFIEQTMPEMLAEDEHISIYLGYGWFAPTGSDVAPDEYETKSLGIAKEVCECLHDQGFEVDWNGDIGRKIRFDLTWQRRTMLV